jgi:transposase
MNTIPSFPLELWEQTPIAVQEYIRTLEVRVAELEATVQRLLERLQQDSHNSARPPSSDPPQALRQRPRRVPRRLSEN